MSEGIGEETLVHPSRGLLKADSLRNPNQPYRRDYSMARIRRSGEADPVSQRHIAGFRPQRFDDSNALTAESCGKIRFACACTVIERLPDQFAAPLLDIEKIQARRMDANPRLSGARNRHRDVFQLHNFRSAVSMNANGPHYSYMRSASCVPRL